MTTNKPGSVNQSPIFGCTSCHEVFSWPAEDLRVYDGECWCDLCWDERKWDLEDQPCWRELPCFEPPYKAEAEALQAENDQLRQLAVECAEYLNFSEYTFIHHGSCLHRRLIDAAMTGESK